MMNPMHPLSQQQNHQEHTEPDYTTELKQFPNKKDKTEAWSSINKDDSSRNAFINQMDIPWERVESRFDPVFMQCDGKIVKYDSKGLAIWRALVSFSYTIISDGDTWYHLNLLTIICFMTMAVCYFTGSYKSASDNNAVVNRIQLLISFVLASYVTIVINRWDRIRNTTYGQQWGALENLNYIAYVLIGRDDSDRARKMKETILRHSRLNMFLTFMALQGDGDLGNLEEKCLVTVDERKWLEATALGTRPLMVISWMSNFFDDLIAMGYKYGDVYHSMIVTNLMSLRGGVGGTLGTIGCQLPYPYVHIVYWTIQILLTALSVETGVILAVYIFSEKNGDGEYSPADDNVAWPASPRIWYLNKFLQITAANIVFALFCEGLLKVCDKLSNPMSVDETSFSERVYDAFLHNNCRSMSAGIINYDMLDSTKENRAAKGPLPMNINSSKNSR